MKVLLRPVLTLGNFDGVHLGHRRIFAKIVKEARKIKGTSVVYTYDPHPAKVVAKPSNLMLLQTLRQKLSSVKACGIDSCIVQKFTKRFSQMTAKKFFNSVILKKIKPVEVIIGYDFTFGLKRSGTVELLERLCAQNGIKFKVIDAVFSGGTLISSSQIRKYILEGDMKNAGRLLGRPYSIVGKVVKGRGIGAELGIHTANLKVENELIPPIGVYATRALKRASVTNIGYSPTFGGGSLSVETHIIGYSGSLYGKKIEVEFLKRLRDERMFGSIESLKKQIEIDIRRSSIRQRRTRLLRQRRISLRLRRGLII